MKNKNPFVQYAIEKGYTEKEVRETSPEVKEVPVLLRDRYATYEEYLEGMHDYLCGL